MDVKLILAPLQGYTDAVFREIYTNHFSGLDEALAPFVSTMGEQRLKPGRIKDVLPENNPNLPVVPQILGNVGADFIFMARHLTHYGYDTMNWNMGCPHSKIAKKKRGSGMLPWPDMVDALLDEVFSAGVCKLSVKVRLGRKDKEEIFKLLPVFEKYPLEEIIVHPRTGVQMYEGDADIDAFERVTHHTDHCLVYNGDITSREKFEMIQYRFPQIQKFMIGRGILADPFLPARIKGLSWDHSRELEIIKAFHDELFYTYSEKFFGPVHVTGRMKGFWAYIGPSFKDSRKPLKKLLKARDRDAYKQAADTYFASCPLYCPLPEVNCSHGT